MSWRVQQPIHSCFAFHVLKRGFMKFDCVGGCSSEEHAGFVTRPDSGQSQVDFFFLEELQGIHSGRNFKNKTKDILQKHIEQVPNEDTKRC